MSLLDGHPLEHELTKCRIALLRAEKALLKEFHLLTLPKPGDSKVSLARWSVRFRRARATSDLDLHALAVTAYELVNRADKYPAARKLITAKMAEVIKIMRHHYEHWDNMKHFYRSDNVVTPKKPRIVDTYCRQYRGNTKASPKGSLMLDYDRTTNPPTPIIVVGEALNLSELSRLITDLKKYLR